MRVYRNATFITATLTIASLGGALFFNFCTDTDPFWCNLLLGVFGSGLLTFITSVIGYQVERRKTFEGFSYCTKQLLKALNKYQASWTLDEKIDFFLALHDVSWFDWDRYFGDFCFLFDWNHKNRTYIYEKIYHPLQEVDQKINFHVWHFRWHKDGSGRNEKVMGIFVQEIEDIIMETSTKMFYGDGEPQPEKGFPITQTRNKIVEDVKQELKGEYYRLMYGSKTYKESQQ